MTICPIAMAVGCKKCPIFSICPATRIIGDQGDAAPAPTATASAEPKKANNNKRGRTHSQANRMRNKGSKRPRKS